MTTFGKGKG